MYTCLRTITVRQKYSLHGCNSESEKNKRIGPLARERQQRMEFHPFMPSPFAPSPHTRYLPFFFSHPIDLLNYIGHLRRKDARHGKRCRCGRNTRSRVQAQDSEQGWVKLRRRPLPPPLLLLLMSRLPLNLARGPHRRTADGCEGPVS